ncbi:endonuclease/exonuclease/phosphatase family protein [Yoonia sp. R2-816]|uniref:endonuclease/exonuclease/phosphatase family protein n=1 Tax=Yoonia sp. R2-816 TaxID=3342638 RepID=UPI003727BF5B
MDAKISTFNIENLFTRFNFGAFTSERDQRYLPPVIKFLGDFANQDGDLSKFDDFKRLMQSAAVAQDDDKRQHTALAMAEADPMIFCLQEVDGIGALERFRDAYLYKATKDRFPQLVLQEGNDPRGIDVAAMTRDIRPVMARSHAWLTPGWLGNADRRRELVAEFPDIKEPIKQRRRVFRRDCLELEIRDGDDSLTIFNCHFKSMGGGRKATIGVRQLEALSVREIIRRKFPDPAVGKWVVVGDLNDYRMQVKVRSALDGNGNPIEEVVHLADDKPSGIDPLVKDGFGFNVVDVLPENERWTHYYASDRTKTQLDYIIVSPALRESVRDVEIIRGGQPYRVPNSGAISRYPRIGHDRPKASDHCPVVATVTI